MNTRVKHTVRILFVLVVLLGLGVAWTLTTSAGLRLLIGAAEKLSGGTVMVQSSSGSLSSGAQLRGIRVNIAAGTLGIEHLSVRCDCRLVMLGIVDLDKATASGVSLKLSGAGGTGQPAAYTPWPVALLIEDLELNDITLQLPGTQVRREITHLSTHVLMRRGHLALGDLHLVRPRLQIRYNGRIGLRAPFHLQSRAGWTAVLQDRIPLAGSARVHGDENRLQAEVTLHSPLAAHIAIDLGDPLGARIWNLSINSNWANLRRLGPALPASLSTRVVLKGSGKGETGRVRGQFDVRQSEGGAKHSARFRLAAAVTPGAPDRKVTATLAWDRIAWPFKDFTLTSPGGALHLNGAHGGLVLTGKNTFGINGNPAALELDAALSGKELDLRTGRLTVGEASVAARGSVTLAPGGPAMNLHLQWHNVSGRLPWLGVVRSGQGSGELHGRADAWTLASSGSLGGEHLPPGQFEINGFGHAATLTLDNWQLHTLNGAVDGSGRIILSGRRSFTLQFNGQGLDPGRHWPGWNGKLGVTGFARSSPGQQTNLQLSIDGQLRKRAVKLDLDLGVSPDLLAIRQLHFSAGSASAGIHGSIGTALNLTWQADAPDLNAVAPHLSGRLVGEGQILGSDQKPEIQGRLTAVRIQSPWFDLKELRAQADLGLATGDKLEASVSVAGLRRGASPPADLDVRLHGDTANHQLQVNGNWGKSTLALAGAGSLQGDTWRGKITDLSITAAGGQAWTLANPATADFAAGQASLGKLCLQGQKSRWCARGTWAPTSGAWTVQASADAAPLQWFRPLLPATISVAGSAALDAAAAGTGAALQSARGDITLHGAALQFDTGNASPYRLPLRAGTGRLRLDGDQLRARLEVDFKNAAVNPLTAELTLGGVTGWPLTPAKVRINGSVSAGADDISFLSTAFPYATDLHGGVQADVKLSGTLTAPQLGGAFTIRDCSFDAPDLGTHIDHLNLKGESTGEDRYHINGKLTSGKGSLTIAGNLNPAGSGGTGLKISGTRFELVNLPELWALVSPDLHVTWSGGAPMVTGRVDVPEAKLNLDEAVVKTPVSDDVVVAGPKSEARRAKSPMPGSDIQLVLGKDISVSGRGVSGKLSGTLHLTSRPGSKLLADGEIAIRDGAYSAYGQSLKIQEGRLIYRQAQLDNPSLSVRAVRTIQDISAGVSVSGYLTQPVVSLFSSPSMSQEETLSYIVFGRPLKNLSSGNGSDLMAAATSMGLQNTGLVTSSIASMFGLNKLQVQAGETTESASLLIGKYLTPRLYLSYGLGLFQSLATGKLRYDLTKHWAIEAERSNEFGVDVLYKIEK